jgi:hypothetical protein
VSIFITGRGAFGAAGCGRPILFLAFKLFISMLLVCSRWINQVVVYAKLDGHHTENCSTDIGAAIVGTMEVEPMISMVRRKSTCILKDFEGGVDISVCWDDQRVTLLNGWRPALKILLWIGRPFYRFRGFGLGDANKL